MPRLYLHALAAALFLSACTSFPEVDAAQARLGQPDAPAPQLLPVEGLLAQAEGARATKASGDALAARAARLRARAVAMRGPVQDPATRARLAQAIRNHPQG